MLLQRIATALVLIPLVAAAVLYLPTNWLAVLLAFLVVLGGLEWARLAGLGTGGTKVLYLASIAAAMVGMLLLYRFSTGWVFPVVAVVAAGWIAVGALLIWHPSPMRLVAGQKVRLLTGMLVLVPAWGSLLAVHELFRVGPFLVLFVMVLIWIADSCAYFAGRRWGHTKLAPSISPGKTREGVYGALAGAVICGILLYLVRPETGPLIGVVAFAVGIALISVVGDLFESLIKRLAGIKDSGSLLPGHGGVMDRIDSLTAALPVFLFGLLLLEKVN